VRSLHDAVGRELVWRPRGLLSRTYDLVDPESEAMSPEGAAGADAYATLVTHVSPSFSPNARAETADGRWLFQPRGLFRRGVIVLAEGAETPLATFHRYWRRGVVRFQDGRELIWRRESFWSRTWLFEDAGGGVLMRFRRRLSFPRARTGLELDSSAGRVAEVPLLACLGWFLQILARRRAAARGA
jgi:hypothetical protein